MKKGFIFSAAAVAMLFVSGCGNKSGEELATVNGESIGVEDLHKLLETKLDFQVQRVDQATSSATLAQTPQFQGFLDLVTRKITMQLAKDKNVAPTTDQINREFEFRKKINAQYATSLMAMGLSLQQIKDQIAFDLARENLLSKGVSVSDAEVDKYIADNADKFTVPEELELYMIEADTPQTKQKVDSELALGKPFQTVAMTYSDSPTVRDDNARVNPTQPTYTQSLAPALKKVIVATPEHKHTGWIKFSSSEAMFYVDKRKPAKKMPVDAVLKERVKRELTQQKGMLAFDLQKQVRDKILESKFNIKDKTLKALWDKYILSLKRSVEEASTPKVTG